MSRVQNRVVVDKKTSIIWWLSSTQRHHSIVSTFHISNDFYGITGTRPLYLKITVKRSRVLDFIEVANISGYTATVNHIHIIQHVWWASNTRRWSWVRTAMEYNTHLFTTKSAFSKGYNEENIGFFGRRWEVRPCWPQDGWVFRGYPVWSVNMFFQTGRGIGGQGSIW